MAAVGTVTVNVEVGEDLEAAIRRIVRDEVAEIAQDASDREAHCTIDGCYVATTLGFLASEARAAG